MFGSGGIMLLYTKYKIAVPCDFRQDDCD